MAFTGKVALVTGGGSGMGQRAVERLAAQGAKVAALDINEAGLAATAASSDDIHTYTVDVTDTLAVADVVAKVEADLGPIDRVMAAAGIMPTDRILDMDTALIRKTMDVNFAGVVNVVKPTLPGMVERHRGDMVIFSSLQGHQPLSNQAAYCASKFAVKAFAEILAGEHPNSGIRFACVCPPAVNTPLVDQLNAEAQSFLDLLPARTRLSPDRVLDAIERGLDKGKFWIMPGIARPAATYYRFFPGMFWKGIHKLEEKNRQAAA